MNTLSHSKETKARKVHICNFCATRIMKGETYEKSTHVHDGEIYDWKTHKYCSKLADRLSMYEDCDDGLTGDDFRNCVDEEHFTVLTEKIPDEYAKELGEIIRQLRHVYFRQKLWFVIRHYNKIDKEKANKVG